MTEPLVGIIMGSNSDWETMRHAADTLDQLGIAHETKVVSAHRTPKRLYDYAHSAKERGLKVIVAGAMAERIVDRLEAVDVHEQHRALGVVAADPRDEPVELAQEAAAVGKVDQAVLVGEMVELLDPLLQLRDLAAETRNLLDEPLNFRVVSYLVSHCPCAALGPST